MNRSFRAPKHPELFGRLVAALRVYGGVREPGNDWERSINNALQTQNLDRSVAKRLTQALDSTPKNIRRRFLGEMAAPEFIGSEAPSDSVFGSASNRANRGSAGGTIGGTASGTVSAAGTHGDLDSSLSTDPGVTPLPNYTLRYQGVFCQAESTFDQTSSADEIYVLTSSVHIADDGSNTVRTERHPAAQDKRWYEDVDNLEQQLGPIAAIWQGNRDPVSVTVVVMEHDQGDPDIYKEEVEYLVKALIALATKLYPPAAILSAFSGTITDAINWFLSTGDDIVSTQTVVLPRAMLEAYAGISRSFYIGYRKKFTQHMTNPPSTTVTNVPFSTNLMHHFLTTHVGGGATYIVGFDVDRNPPLNVSGIFL